MDLTNVELAKLKDKKVKVLNWDGDLVREIEFPNSLSVSLNFNLMKEVLAFQRHKLRQRSCVKTRGETSYSDRKMRPQKRSGRARMGDKASPHLRGGGVSHGPTGDLHSMKINKNTMKKCISMCIFSRFSSGNLFVLENLDMRQIKTKEMVKLKSILSSKSTLFVDSSSNINVRKSINNIIQCDFLPEFGINPASILSKEDLVITEKALSILGERL